MRLWTRGGLRVSALMDPAVRRGSTPGWIHCVIFSGETLYSRRASLHPGMGTGKINAEGKPAMDWHPI